MKKSITMDSLSSIGAITSVCRSMFEVRGPLEVIVQDLDKSRSTAQNRLAFLWYKAAADQLEDGSAEEKRAYCKLHFGVPIRRGDDAFREVYDRVIRPLTYEQKLELMAGVIDFPVTRDMTTKDMKQYLEAVEVFFAGLLVDLPKPENLYLQSMGLKRG